MKALQIAGLAVALALPAAPCEAAEAVNDREFTAGEFAPGGGWALVSDAAAGTGSWECERGRRSMVAGSRRDLAAGTDPAQVGFSPDGARLVVTQRGTNAIAVYPVLETGHLGEPVVQPSSGPTPYGFAFTKGGGLVVTEAFGAQAGKAAASSYRISDAGAAPVSRSVGNGRSEICWAVVTSDGRYAFTTNFGDGAVSRYSIGDDGSIALEEAAAGLAVDGQTGLRDEDLSGDGRFLYAIDADSRRVFGWAVGAGGSLSPVGSWQGLPATVAGLAAS